MITEPLTYEQKAKLYYLGKWSCPPPPVPSGQWEEKDWIAWIDHEGLWG